VLEFYRRLAVWSQAHKHLLVAVAVAAIPVPLVAAFVLNALNPVRNHAIVFYWTAPLGIWAIGALVSIPYFASSQPADPCSLRVLRVLVAIALSLWFISPIGIFAVLLS
jgi:hypothetical protein